MYIIYFLSKCVLTAQNVFLNFDMFSDFTFDMVCCLFYRDAFLADVVCLIQSRQCALHHELLWTLNEC